MYILLLSICVLILGISLMVIGICNEWIPFIAISVVIIFISVLFLTISIATAIGYSEFEQEYTLVKNYYDNFTASSSHTDITYIINPVDINKSLFNYQATYLRWGKFSTVPARVMELKPIE